MTPLATQFWDWLTAAGGTLALSFIVAIALGICATTVLFLGSAVVVLERFARATHRFRNVVIVTVVWAALLGALGTDVETLAGLGIPWPGAFRAWLLASAGALGFVAGAQVVIGLVLRYVPPTTLAMASAVLLAIGYALLVGGIDRVGYAIAPALVAALVFAGLRWRRRRNGESEPGIDERLVRTVAIVLGVGVAIPLALPAPEPDRLRPGRRHPLGLDAGGPARSAAPCGCRVPGYPRNRRVVRRHPLSLCQAPADLHIGHHADLCGGGRRGCLADHHRPLGHERLRTHLAGGDHREPGPLHRPQRPRVPSRTTATWWRTWSAQRKFSAPLPTSTQRG